MKILHAYRLQCQIAVKSLQHKTIGPCSIPLPGLPSREYSLTLFSLLFSFLYLNHFQNSMLPSYESLILDMSMLW